MPAEVMQLPSVMKIFLTSWIWLEALRTEVFGSFPIRTVPISWTAEPPGAKWT